MTSQSAATQSPSGAGRAEPGAGSRTPGWGRGPSAAKRERARPSPRSAAAGPGAMEPDNSPRKIQFTVPLLEPHLDPEAAEQVQTGRGSGTRRRTGDLAVGSESLPRPSVAPHLFGNALAQFMGVSIPSPNSGATPRHQYGSLCLVSPRAWFTRCPAVGTRPFLRLWRPYIPSHPVNPQSFPARWHRWAEGYRREGAQGGGRRVGRGDSSPYLRVIRTWALSVAPKGMRTAIEALWSEGGGLQAGVPFCKSEHVGPGYNSALWSREWG